MQLLPKVCRCNRHRKGGGKGWSTIRHMRSEACCTCPSWQRDSWTTRTHLSHTHIAPYRNRQVLEVAVLDSPKFSSNFNITPYGWMVSHNQYFTEVYS